MIHFKFKVAYLGFEAYGYGSFAELPASWTVEISRSETHIELFERTFEFSDLHQFKENLDAFFKYLEEWWEIEIGDVYFCTRAE